MRRPLEWIAVTICLGLVLAHQQSRLPPESPAVAPVVRAASFGLRSERANPFAWVQEDGSEVYLPAVDTHEADTTEEEPGILQPSSTMPALYSWSSPMNGAESERAWYP